MSTEHVVEVEGLITRFGKVEVHRGLSLSLRRGEILGVVGGSGTGKSVLMRTIIGLKKPEAGRILLFGEDVTDRPAGTRGALEQRIGVLFQDGALFSSLTVLENVLVPIREFHPGLDDDLARCLARLKIAIAGLQEDAAGKYPSELSGGMRKRAGLARALALDPELLFLDEPTAGLDPITAGAFDELVRTLAKALRLTVFLITHDLDTLYRVCDRVAVLGEGKVLIVGTLEEVEAHPHPWIQRYFLGPRGRAAARARMA